MFVQVIIALTGGELLYFELDAMGQLAETDKREMGADVAALDVGPVPPGRQRSRFLAVGSFDSTIRVISLDPADTMKVRILGVWGYQGFDGLRDMAELTKRHSLSALVHSALRCIGGDRSM